MEGKNSRFQQDIDELVAGLETVRDELRVRAHLANLDLRDRLRALERELDDARSQIKSSTTAVRQVLLNLKASFESLREKFPPRRRSRAA